MTTSAVDRWAGRCVEVVLVTFALVGLVALLVFAGGGELPDFVLPAAVVAAIVLQRWRCVGSTSLVQRGERPWLLGGVVLVVGVAALVAWGALATASRTWDGAAMWDVKAALLTERLTLEQPAFCDPGILLHSRDYPLLQPVLIAALERWTGAGRLLFPLVFATHTALLFVLLRRAGVALRFAVAMAVAFAVTPMVLSPSGGGADSGYAEPLLALAVTATVGGLVGADRLLVVVGIALLVWAKPEGGLYGALAVAMAWLRNGRGPMLAATSSWCAAMALWLVVQRELLTFGRGGFAGELPGAVLAIGGAVVATHRLVPNTRHRTWLLAGVAAAGALTLPLVLPHLDLGGGVFAGFASGATRIGERLAEAPRILFGIANWAWLRGRFGLAFVAVVVVAWRLRGDRTRDPLRWLVLAAGIVVLPFLLAPFDDLDAHIRASMPRLLCHHVGVAWLAIGLCCSASQPNSPTTA
jgi:hypothetical protein